MMMAMADSQKTSSTAANQLYRVHAEDISPSERSSHLLANGFSTG
jgi:hypothetical protein